MDDLKQAAQRPGSFLQTVKAVGWSFFGVRSSKGYKADVTKINPVHVILAGIIGAALFVGVLLLIVRAVVN